MPDFAKREVELFRRGDDDAAGAQRILLECACPYATVQRRNTLSEWNEGLLKVGLCLG